VAALFSAATSVIVWWSTPVECESAFCRLHRQGVFDDRQSERARQALHELSGEWSEVQATPSIRTAAIGILRRHPLRAADALQLAAASIVAHATRDEITFVTLDQRLRAAAILEGFVVAPS
jgi:predicted nucleic acid-binding protein